MKHLMGTTAIVALLAAAPAFAQTDTAPMQPMQESDETLGTDAVTDGADLAASEMWIRDEGQVLVNDLIGTEVFDANGESLGDIENFIISLAPTAAGVPEASMESDAIEPEESLDAAESETETILPEDGAPESGQAELDLEEPAAGGAEGEVAVSEPLPESDAPESDAGGESLAESTEPLPQTDSGAQDLAQGSEPLPESGAEADQSLAETTEPLPQEQSGDQFAADQADSMAEPESDTVVAEEVEPSVEPESDMAAADTESEPLSGETVMTPSAEHSQSIEVTAAIIGVGGFLGIGEKDVAVGIENLEFMSDENGDRRIVLNTTREELEAAPEFSEEEIEGEGGAAMDDGAAIDGGAVDGAAN